MGKKVQNFIITSFLFLFSLIPFSLLYIFSDILCFILKNWIRYRKKTIEDNLRYSFPEKSNEEREVIKNRFYVHLSDLILEGIKMFHMNEMQVRKHFVSPIHNHELNPNQQRGLEFILSSRSCIGMLGHYGNWEWASFASTLSFPNKSTWIIYKTLNNKDFDRLINQVRSKFGAEMVEMKNVLRKFVNETNKSFLAYFVSDQSPMLHSSHHKVNFLNQETLVYLGAEKIAHSKNIPVLYIEIQKIQRGIYASYAEVLVENPSEMSPEEINALYQARLEKTIREKPEYWLWSHKRWKYTRKPETLTK